MRELKKQMQRAIQSTLGLGKLPEPADVADAIAAALCCGHTEDRGQKGISNKEMDSVLSLE